MRNTLTMKIEFQMDDSTLIGLAAEIVAEFFLFSVFISSDLCCRSGDILSTDYIFGGFFSAINVVFLKKNFENVIKSLAIDNDFLF